MRITSLRETLDQVRRVGLVGGDQALPFRHEPDALVVRLPDHRPAFTPVLRIEGPGLT
jgi:alpha-L-fucosidase